jgi:predicted DNA-binding transcriptional regulator AlpA
MGQKKSEIKGPERLLTGKQAAHYLGMSEALFYGKGYVGLIRPVRLSGARGETMRFDMQDLDAFIEKCKEVPAV